MPYSSWAGYLNVDTICCSHHPWHTTSCTEALCQGIIIPHEAWELDKVTFEFTQRRSRLHNCQNQISIMILTSCGQEHAEHHNYLGRPPAKSLWRRHDRHYPIPSNNKVKVGLFVKSHVYVYISIQKYVFMNIPSYSWYYKDQVDSHPHTPHLPQ